MFGFVVANPEKLSADENHHYKSVYCGICEELGRHRKFRNRLALTYEAAFLAVVLSAVNGEAYTVCSGRCPVHPLKKRSFEKNVYTAYAADMNIILAYYKYLDDIKDDNSFSAKIKAKMFAAEAAKVSQKYPVQCRSVESCLKELSHAEKENILLPDIPADIFGRLLGNIFNVNNSKELYNFGYSLGKFIYTADAAVDRKKDIQKKKYNPLIQYRKNDIEPLLHMLMADCVEKYKVLPVKKDREIIENVLFSGIWTVYDARMKRKENEIESESV